MRNLCRRSVWVNTRYLSKVSDFKPFLKFSVPWECFNNGIFFFIFLHLHECADLMDQILPSPLVSYIKTKITSSFYINIHIKMYLFHWTLFARFGFIFDAFGSRTSQEMSVWSLQVGYKTCGRTHNNDLTWPDQFYKKFIILGNILLLSCNKLKLW